MAEGPSSEPSEAEKAGVRAQLRGTLDKLNENRSNLTQTNSRGLCEVRGLAAHSAIERMWWAEGTRTHARRMKQP